MKDKSKYYKSLFLTCFDGGYEIEPEPNTPSTFEMGVCKLEYEEDSNTLNVHLRRPGLLIGKGGRTINTLDEHLDCHIRIIEVNLIK
jgi:ribosomal protein S3